MLIKIDLASWHKKVCFSWKESFFFFRSFINRKGQTFCIHDSIKEEPSSSHHEKGLHQSESLLIVIVTSVLLVISSPLMVIV